MSNNRPEIPAPIVPPYKVRREVRTYLHGQGFHNLCRIRFEPAVSGYDHSRKYLSGPLHTEVDPASGTVTTTRDMIDASTMFGDPIYSGKIKEIHE